MGGQLKIGNVMLGRCGGASVMAITLSGGGGGVASGRGLLMAREEQASTPRGVRQRQAQHSTQASSRTRILRLRGEEALAVATAAAAHGTDR